MKVDIKERNKNPLLERNELKGIIDHKNEATPSSETLKKFISKELDVEEEKVKIDKIFTLKGRQKSKFWAKEEGLSKDEAKSDKEEEFECEECGKTFDSKRGLSIHQSQAHKEEEEVDYEEVVGGTISEAKDKINDMDNPDYEELLKAEKNGKDRKGMKKYLKPKVEE